jgi:predicted  nucleic acid-binding Zn-ribbon protein
MNIGFMIIVIIGIIFGVGALAIITEHLQKMAQIRRSHAPAESNTRLLETLTEIQHEVKLLRETTSEFDLSFDTALQRIESRVSNIEQRVNNLEQQTGIQRISPS